MTDWPHGDPPGPGVTFTRPPRREWNWPFIGFTVLFVLLWLAFLAVVLIVPEFVSTALKRP